MRASSFSLNEEEWGKSFMWQPLFIVPLYIMIFWSIKMMTISILFIFLVHHLISYFMATLTVPKIKDLVHAPQRKYKEIHQLLASSTAPLSTAPLSMRTPESTTRLQDLDDGNMTRGTDVEASSTTDYFSQLLERKEYLGGRKSNANSNAIPNANPIENDILSMKSELKDFLHSHLKTDPDSQSFYSLLKTA